MKWIVAVSALLLLFGYEGEGQENEGKDWSIRPTISIVKFLPGEEIVVPCEECLYANSSKYRFAGTGISFGVRAIPPDLRSVAFTFGTGVNWFYPPDNGYSVGTFEATASKGIGEILGRQEFNTFPISAGVQLFIPQSNPDAFMAFLGIDGTIHFIDGDLPIGDQTRLGYDLLAGFAVKVFEMSVRYAVVSDVRNIGVQFGLRLPSFGL